MIAGHPPYGAYYERKTRLTALTTNGNARVDREAKRSGYFFKMLDFGVVGAVLLWTQPDLLYFVKTRLAYGEDDLGVLSDAIFMVGVGALVVGGINLIPTLWKKARNCFVDVVNAAAFGFVGWEIWTGGKGVLKILDQPNPEWQRVWTFLNWGDYVVGFMIFLNLVRVGAGFRKR